MLKRTRLKDVTPLGTAAARIYKNVSRLHDWYYQPGIVGTEKAENVGWPGDWEGRTVLALTLEAQALKSEPAYLDEIVKWICENRNQLGYRGEEIEPDAINEQSLAGHGWLLRGLIEYYKYKEQQSVKDIITDIINNLYLPLRGKFAAYPKNPGDRIYEGEAAGQLAGITVSGWKISSDTGCAFIALDGISQAYELLRTEELKELIEEMVEIFTSIDFIGITMQTHATLTASRGVMRMYKITKNPAYLEFCKNIVGLYKQEGMTENYANYNWFSRPSWTEPCGIIDSFMMAFQLWEETGLTGYLEDAHGIWYNGVCRGQRPNGGFGCDHCVEDGYVKIHENYYEAYWCCSMRGGEGTTAVTEYSLYGDDKRIVLPFYSDGQYNIPWISGLKLKVRSKYPRAGQIVIEVLETGVPDAEIELCCYIPDWAEQVQFSVEGAVVKHTLNNDFAKITVPFIKGCRILLSFEIPLIIKPVIGNWHKESNLSTLRHGNLILGTESPVQKINMSEMELVERGIYRYRDALLTPLDEAYLLEEEKVREAAYRILFEVES